MLAANRRFLRILLFAARLQRVSLAAFFVGAVLLLGVVRLVGVSALGAVWQWADTIVGLLTLFVAAVVWYGEAAEDWEASLPKRLRAVFLHDGQPAMICENAVLVSENDIRAWAQQVGAQMAGERQLALAPFFTLGEPCLIEDGSQVCKLYEIHLHLRNLPARVVQIRGAKGPGACLVWRQHELQHEERIDLGCGGGMSELAG